MPRNLSSRVVTISALDWQLRQVLYFRDLGLLELYHRTNYLAVWLDELAGAHEEQWKGLYIHVGIPVPGEPFPLELGLSLEFLSRLRLFEYDGHVFYLRSWKMAKHEWTWELLGLDHVTLNCYANALSQSKERAKGVWKATSGSQVEDNPMRIRIPHQ